MEVEKKSKKIRAIFNMNPLLFSIRERCQLFQEVLVWSYYPTKKGPEGP
jgi:hypothetical protein